MSFSTAGNPSIPQAPAGVLLPSAPLSQIPPNALFTIPTLPQDPDSHHGRSHRAARGAEIDAGGRRGGRPDPDDHGDVDGDDKEILPAYDHGTNGPPKYAEVMIGNVLSGRERSRGESMEMVDMRRSQSSTRLDGPERQTSQNHDIPTTTEEPNPTPTTTAPEHSQSTDLS